MSVLRSIEQKIESLFEGIFGRAFRTNVQPVEIARKLVKELEDHKTVSVSKVYVPNEYTVYLSTADREQFATYEDSLRVELAEYLAEHARREHLAVMGKPVVLFETDEDLDLGEFGIATRIVQRRGGPSQEPDVEPGATMVYRTPAAQQATGAASPTELGVAREVVTLTANGTRHEVTDSRVVIGRSRDCDVQLPDPNVSRRHAEVRREGSTYWLVDLDSTNGSQLNGRRTARAKLEDGDTITVGSTDLVFERRLAE